jgi:outer membrane protein OmpA-like peptidoglycan-associated protein
MAHCYLVHLAFVLDLGDGFSDGVVTLHRQLDQLAVILERNATIGLDLNAHTDARGDAAYNLKLSQQRADAAIGYLSSKGLPSQRFNSRGFGESRLLNECCDGVSCTEPEHALNRRTEIRLRTLSDTAVLPE